MSVPTDALLTDEERAALKSDSYAADRHQSLDGEVHYRIRLFAARPERIDAETAERIVADARLLRERGHNGLVSMVRRRLGDHLPEGALGE
ncbi:MAG: hypothetical protein ABEJ23_01320 [Haloarculaceae archaeon]